MNLFPADFGRIKQVTSRRGRHRARPSRLQANTPKLNPAAPAFKGFFGFFKLAR